MDTEDQGRGLDSAAESLQGRGIRPEHIVTIAGRGTFVLYAGLLDLAHFLGLSGISTRLVQAPSAPAWTAIVHATATKCVPGVGGEPTTFMTFDGIGDANESNTNSTVTPHIIRVAETRAKARALRDMTNIGSAALEELGGDGAARPISISAGPAAAQWQAEPGSADEHFELLRDARPAGAADAVTPKQKWLVMKLLNEQGISVDPKTWATKDGAKALIDTLLKKGGRAS